MSIDIDGIATYSSTITTGNFDDIDSFAEYILEKAVGDDHYTSEEDNDRNATDKGFEKYDVSNLLFFEPFMRSCLRMNAKYIIPGLSGLENTNKTCNGYYNIVSPPPEA